MRHYVTIAVLALLTACQPQPPAEVSQAEPVPAVEASPTDPPLSNELYEKIENGWTLEQAQEILGEGTELSRSEVEGFGETVIHMWAEDGGIRNITVTIQDGVIISKAKAGF